MDEALERASQQAETAKRKNSRYKRLQGVAVGLLLKHGPQKMPNSANTFCTQPPLASHWNCMDSPSYEPKPPHGICQFCSCNLWSWELQGTGAQCFIKAQTLSWVPHQGVSPPAALMATNKCAVPILHFMFLPMQWSFSPAGVFLPVFQKVQPGEVSSCQCSFISVSRDMHKPENSVQFGASENCLPRSKAL